MTGLKSIPLVLETKVQPTEPHHCPGSLFIWLYVDWRLRVIFWSTRGVRWKWNNFHVRWYFLLQRASYGWTSLKSSHRVDLNAINGDDNRYTRTLWEHSWSNLTYLGWHLRLIGYWVWLVTVTAKRLNVGDLLAVG